jgi:hypothetical protein
MESQAPNFTPLIQVLAFGTWVQMYKKKTNKLHAINFQKKKNE